MCFGLENQFTCVRRLGQPQEQNIFRLQNNPCRIIFIPARNALLSYIDGSNEAGFVDGKMIFLQGSPEMESENGIPIGRLSGIVAHHVPQYLQKK